MPKGEGGGRIEPTNNKRKLFKLYENINKQFNLNSAKEIYPQIKKKKKKQYKNNSFIYERWKAIYLKSVLVEKNDLTI